MRKYIPIIKTTDAEIKGYRYLSSEVKKAVLPVFELTRSRPVKGYPDGDIHRRMKQIEKYSEGNPFILDLTKHPDLMNPQINALIDDSDAFSEWRFFLKQHSHLNIIPVLHLYPDNLPAYKECVEKLSLRFEKFAFRVGWDTEANDFLRYLEQIEDLLDLESSLIVVVDGEYTGSNLHPQKLSSVISLLAVLREKNISEVSVNSSSFPASVAAYGDSSGEIPMRELELHKKAAEALENYSSYVAYGDYAGIHPIRYSIAGGNWVPRIDVSLDASYIYTRWRREDGGYVKAAREMIKRPDFSPVDCWGKEQILQAATGNPEGKSPSFWISVRLNQHVSRFSQLYNDLFI